LFHYNIKKITEFPQNAQINYLIMMELRRNHMYTLTVVEAYVVGNAEAAADSEHGEQDEVPGVLLAIFEHGEHDCSNKTNYWTLWTIGTKVFLDLVKGMGVHM
jgi:hypothetical protein